MTMHYQQIHYSVDEHIATITLNRPEVLNAYTPDMGDEIVAAFRTAEKDDSVRAVILTGAGERGFCAGADRVYLQNPLPAGTRLIGEEALIRSYPLELANFPKGHDDQCDCVAMYYKWADDNEVSQYNARPAIPAAVLAAASPAGGINRSGVGPFGHSKRW